ncbi:rRNA maturation RNase YbeY [Alteromonas sp. H39]|uniref:rRNA maturation RNase YbeY n=1 Tax=Alteromonas sp. H39 TaxID=3389876 RepID=UPI0039E09EA2
MTAQVDYQRAFESEQLIPDEAQVTAWASEVYEAQGVSDQEVTIRFVDEEESQALNYQFRGKDKPTNVLSFPFECPPDIPVNLLGDLVVCVPVIHREAEEQGKNVEHHYAHMIVHGILHLLGFDHQNDDEAEEMESREIHILSQLEIDDPYQEH